MDDKIFVPGLFWSAPSENAPAWVIGKISLRINDLIPFLEAHVNNAGFVNVDIKLSKKGDKAYAELNTYVPTGSPIPADPEGELPVKEYPQEDIDASSIPF